MKAIPIILRDLADSPYLLRDLLANVPEQMLRQRRKAGKWSIHEHACHLSDVQHLLYDRLLTFKNVEYPVFEPFLPGTNFPDDHLLKVDLETALDTFTQERGRQLELVQTFEEHDWDKEAIHPEYHSYTAEILLRHLLMHDHHHMYRIEQLWLTKEHFLRF